MDTYNHWLNSEGTDAQTKEELLSIANDKEEIEKRFYCELEFGTAGLRGILGAGTNRINKYIFPVNKKIIEGKTVQAKKEFLKRLPFQYLPVLLWYDGIAVRKTRRQSHGTKSTSGVPPCAGTRRTSWTARRAFEYRNGNKALPVHPNTNVQLK